MTHRPQLTCNKCGWVHVAVLREECAPGTCLGCFRCGNPSNNFRPAKEGDSPTGSTIQGLVVDDDGEAAAAVREAKKHEGRRWE